MTSIPEQLRKSDPVSAGRLEDVYRAPIFDELFQAIVSGSDDVPISLPLRQQDATPVPHRGWSRLGPVPLVPLGVAAALIIALIIAVPGLRSPQGSHGASGHQHKTNGATTRAPAWRLVGDVSQAWQLQPSSGFEPGFYITCPTTSTCYAGDIDSETLSDLEVTNDGGSTWQQSALPVTLSQASRLVCVDAATCAVLGVDGSGNSYFVETTDGGQSWTTAPGPSQLTSAIGVVEMSCTSGSSCVALVSDPTGQIGADGAYVTDDGGNTWTETSLPQGYVPEALQCVGASMCTSVGYVGSPAAPIKTPPPAMALYSTDGGSTWATASFPPMSGVLKRVSCADASDCMASFFGLGNAGTTDAELVSSDGGQTWVEAGSAAQVTMALSCPSGRDCWASGTSLPHQSGQPLTGSISSTSDGGQSWQNATLPSGIGPVVDISCPSDTSCFAIALQPVSGQPNLFANPELLAYGS